MSGDKIRIGIMGFGEIGRQLYHLAAESDRFEVVAISDLGKPEILHYLLSTTSIQGADIRLEGNYLVNPAFRTRVMQTDRPMEAPWDLFGTDVVIDATGKFSAPEDMQSHLTSGAGRVLLSTLPIGPVDRLLIPGINDHEAQVADRTISGGSATTGAWALLLAALSERFSIDAATLTSVHAYTSDQPLQDYAGKDFRRSRSAAENIIPNTIASIPWLEQLLPALEGKLSGHALNVPVQKGSMLDVNLVFEDATVTAEAVNQTMIEASEGAYRGRVSVVADPIVSCDVIGNRSSLLFDLEGTLKGGGRMVKVLGWYESLGHAVRLLEIAEHYAQLDAGGAS